jgi:hypothetical protein
MSDKAPTISFESSAKRNIVYCLECSLNFVVVRLKAFSENGQIDQQLISIILVRHLRHYRHIMNFKVGLQIVF